MHTKGNNSLLESHLVGFLAGSKIAVLSVLPTLDWASEVSAREDVSIVSGFHSPLECRVLELLLRGKCGIVCILARSLYTKIPLEYMPAYTEGRVLFVSKEKQNRSSKESASRRNQLVADYADELVMPKILSDSSLYPIMSSFTRKISIL